MYLKSLIFIVSLFNTAYQQNAVSTELNSHDCKIMFTYGYGYNRFFHVSESGGQVGDSLTIRFLVRARSDAHLLLATSSAPSEDHEVYEVVLGAGKNTFSDIRRLRRSATKATARTPDLLSPIELRGFWVHLDGRGLLQVGREGEEVPFLFWTDPDPLMIHYFSFCTWTGVVGKWLYDCPIENDTEKIEVIEPQPGTMTEKLRKDLLTNYNPYSPPVLELDHSISVSMNLSFHHVNLDVKRSIITVNGILQMQWTDEKIQWKPDDYGGLTMIHVYEHEVWLPEVILYNSISHGTDLLGHVGLTITSKGNVKWSPPTQLKAWCNLNLDKWPNDIHVCELQLGFWSQQNFLELLNVQNNDMMFGKQQTGSEWNIVKVETESVIIQTPWSEGTDFYEIPAAATQAIRITIKRQSQPYTVLFVAPLTVICIITLLSFWMTSASSGKVSVQLICLILIALFTTTIGNILPAPADHVPRLVLLYSWSMIAGVLSVLTTTLVICLKSYEHTALPPRLFYTCITFTTTRTLLLLPQVRTEAGENYTPLEENLTQSDDCSDVTVTKQHDIQQYWIVLSIAIDRISSIIYFIFLLIIITLTIK